MISKVTCLRLLYAVPFLLLSSCYSEIDLDSEKDSEGRDLLVLNIIANPDSVVRAYATDTYFFSDVHSGHKFILDLNMSLVVNGTSKGEMTFDERKKAYCSDFIPNEGDTLSVSTTYMGQDVSASDIVPRKVAIEALDAERQGPTQYYWSNDYIFTYHITFTDPANERNYYFLKYDGWGDGIYGFMEERNYEYEFVFQQLARQVQTSRPGWKPYSPLGLPFSDDGIDGKTHTLNVKEIVQGGTITYFQYWTCMHRKFWLYSISESYYNYLVSLLVNDTYEESISGGMIDIGLIEPGKVFSNIQGNGVGIMGSYVMDVTEADILDIVGHFPSK